ncbi:Gfo/Idh/MocA family oxidoreductase [candidate division KSB1 bacterium]|nr:Gfo/Idh/MocA family oxidoreductase [candidate division KSB1 bacterium]
MTVIQKNSKNQHGLINRRRFLTSAGTAALSFSIVKPELVRGSDANSKLEIGLIGCGGRGTWIADLFQKHGGFKFVAAADYFPDRVDAFGEKFNIDKTRRYTGLSGYKKLLAGKVDAIVIETPPYFHVEQAAAGVDAGVHVYLAKPIAVDVPGCLTIDDCGKKAADNNLCFLVDFQTRTHEYYREAVKRVQYGEIGRVINGEASYFCGPTWDRMYKFYENGSITPENRLRAWGLERELSGDVITEQNIHALDVASWILDANPLFATGTGGQYRNAGNCWDYFSVIFTFPNNVIVTFNSKQFGKGYDDILCRMYGETGMVDTHYFGSVSISGDKPYKGGSVGNLYTDGAVSNIADFYTNITKKRFANSTVKPSVRSNLTTILGRMAAYRHGQVSWDDMMKANEKFTPDLTGLES